MLIDMNNPLDCTYTLVKIVHTQTKNNIDDLNFPYFKNFK